MSCASRIAISMTRWCSMSFAARRPCRRIGGEHLPDGRPRVVAVPSRNVRGTQRFRCRSPEARHHILPWRSVRPRTLQSVRPITICCGEEMVVTNTASGTFDVRYSLGDRVARLDALAALLDTAFIIPGTNIRFGLDA